MNKTKVLVVENEPIIALDVKMSLERLGYEVIASVSTYQDALSKAYELKPDLAMMDINLDGNKDGIQTAKALKAHYNIPVIFLTSLKELDTIHRARESDPFGYLIKPFKQEDLQSSIEIALFNHNKTTNLQGNLDKMSYAINAMDLPVIILNDSGLVDYMNAQMERMTGWKKEEKKGASINQLLSISGIPAWLFIDKWNQAHDRINCDFNENSILKTRSGKAVDVKGQVGFFHTPETGVSGYVITFINAVGKAENILELAEENNVVPDLTGQFVDNYFFLKDKSSLFRVHVDQINFIEALGNYVKVNTGNKSYTALIPLKDIEKALPPHKFFRIHRSYIVAIDKILAIHATELQVADATLPIGKTFKEDLLKKIQVI